MNKKLRILILFLCLFIPSIVLGESIKMTADEVGIRKGPGTNYDRYGYTGDVGEIYQLKSVDLVKTEKGCDSGYWYNVVYQEESAYICSTYAIINVDQPVVITEEAKTECEAYLKDKGFPQNYWGPLCALKVKYPNWEFESVYTGYDFAAAVKLESCKNSISVYSKAEFLDSTCGNNYDAGYTGASQAAVSYYMNPLNFLDEQNIFMFESAYINEAVQPYYSQLATKMANKKLLNNIPDLPLYVANASVESQASAAFLSARIRIELGSGLLSSGTYAGQLQSALSGTYTTRYGYYYTGSSFVKDSKYSSVDNYYNFYNIGASDGDGVTQRALAYAFKQGWGGPNYDQPTARQIAVTGGAKWTYNAYINKGQQTLYFNKFNFNPASTRSAASHQYMTNISAPVSEGSVLYNAYKELNILSLPFKFVIPVYANVTATIDNSPGGATGDDTNEVTTLQPSTMVVVSGYTLDGNIINNIDANTQLSDLIGKISTQGGTVEVYSNGNRITEGLLGTGMIIKVSNQSETTEFKIMIKGDTSGDGKINTLDLLQVQKFIIGEKELTDVYKTVGDTSGDGTVNTLDLLQIQKSILGIKNI